MSLADIVDSCSNELGELNAIAIKEESDLLQKEYQTILQPCQKSKIDYRRRDCQENRSPNGPSTGQSSTSVLDRQISSTDDTTISSNLSSGAAPICRQFWKAGSYEEGITSKSTIQSSGSYLHIHPKFLHSNATSHKWVFGALAELLDNAIDEIQNGATFVIIDKTTNARDGRPALLIQDDGSGMDPEGMRRCLSFGFSDKKSISAIGRYGNGFKTSSMRLGADAIVFSRHVKDGKLTQSIGLLSYTFLTRTGHNRIVVPMVDYELNQATGKLEMLNQCDEESFTSNLSILLEWSPYTTLEELLKQLDDIGYHGTKVIVYNLWCDDQGIYELDFDTDPEDIRLKETAKVQEKNSTRFLANEQHIANQLRYSLRVYLSILYLKLPQTFSIMLRGRVVLYHNIAIDLKYPEFIMYKPAGSSEGILTSIGFLKEAPHVNIHGFNVYHKNRLILPFWHVVSFSDSRGRGVVGVLEANFIEPTHNKQDFEKTAVFQKLEHRLKEMTWEYWDHHCRLLGYKQPLKKPRVPLLVPAHNTSHKGRIEPVVLNNSSFMSPTTRAVPLEPQLKRKESSQLAELERSKRRAGEAVNGTDTRNLNQAVRSTGNPMDDDEKARVIQVNKKLRAQCVEYEKNEEELNLKVTELRSNLDDLEHEYACMLAELQLLEKPKEEKQ